MSSVENKTDALNNEIQEIQDETVSTLLDACVNAHVITSQIQDGGRLLRKIRQLKVSFCLL